MGCGMKVLFFIAGLGLAVSSPAASAQSLAGVTIGDSETKVMKALPGAINVPDENDQKVRVIILGETTVELCKGKASYIEKTIGSTLTDCLSLVERETSKRGEPTVDSDIAKGSANAESWLFSTWMDHGSAFSVQMHYSGGKHRVSSVMAGSIHC